MHSARNISLLWWFNECIHQHKNCGLLLYVKLWHCCCRLSVALPTWQMPMSSDSDIVSDTVMARNLLELVCYLSSFALFMWSSWSHIQNICSMFGFECKTRQFFYQFSSKSLAYMIVILSLKSNSQLHQSLVPLSAVTEKTSIVSLSALQTSLIFPSLQLNRWIPQVVFVCTDPLHSQCQKKSITWPSLPPLPQKAVRFIWCKLPWQLSATLYWVFHWLYALFIKTCI